MEFTNNEIIIDNDKFINIGKIDDKIAVIISNIKIDNIKFEKNKICNCSNTLIYEGNSLDIFYPCENEHLNINKKSKYIIINETSLEFNSKILPYIKGIYKENIKWINDILYKNSEKERLLYKDEKIVIMIDVICNNIKDINDFYILAIPFENLMTIRDLRKKHIPILKLMKEKCIQIASSYNINSNQLYFFFHYHPSFYHLHLHCCVVNHKELSTKYFRCKMLETVILNLERNSHFYKNGDIMFEIPSNHIISKLLLK